MQRTLKSFLIGKKKKIHTGPARLTIGLLLEVKLQICRLQVLVCGSQCCHLMQIQSSVVLIRMTSSLCYFWRLPFLSPSFRPLADKSHRQQPANRLYPDGYVQKPFSRVGRKVTDSAVSTKHNCYVMLLSDYYCTRWITHNAAWLQKLLGRHLWALEKEAKKKT